MLGLAGGEWGDLRLDVHVLRKGSSVFIENTAGQDRQLTKINALFPPPAVSQGPAFQPRDTQFSE